MLLAKKEAEAKGYMYLTDRDEIISRAKKEGRLRVLTSVEPATLKASSAVFTKKYPFISLDVQHFTGTEAAQRILLEVQSGAARDSDVISPFPDFLKEYIPHFLKIDILGMAGQGVLQIPLQMIDSINRNLAAFHSRFQVTAYNKNLVPANQLPKVWEDLLRPEFKGRKFAVDIRPTEIAALVPAWGLEKTLDFARKVAAQQPIWVRGASRTLPVIVAGEVPMMIGPNFQTVKRAQAKDQAGILQYVILEPVPVRLAEPLGIVATSQHPHAALLYLEWMAGPEAQRIADEYEPLGSSVYVRGGAVEQELRGKKLTVVRWEDYQHIGQWQSKIVEAFGFPKADVAR